MKKTMFRRRWIVVITSMVLIAVTILLGYGPAVAYRYSGFTDTPKRALTPLVEPVLIDLEERTFRFFWDTANPKNGLVPDRYPTPSFASIAAVGFGLTAYPIGVERGYVHARGRPQARADHAALPVERAAGRRPVRHGRIQGLLLPFPRHEDRASASRTASCRRSTPHCCSRARCSASRTSTARIRRKSRSAASPTRSIGRVDWRWAQPRAPAISLGWSPEDGFLEYDWRGYNEAMLVYLLALALADARRSAPMRGQQWTSTYDQSWRTVFGQEHLDFAPLFGHQYSHVWIDFRKIQDAYMRRRGIDYFENSRRAIYAQRAYAIANPLGCKAYGATMWGITASDGPGDIDHRRHGGQARFRSYSARGIGGAAAHDDCTLAPTAAVASHSVRAGARDSRRAQHVSRASASTSTATYGFLDAFNPSFTFTDVTLQPGTSHPGRSDGSTTIISASTRARSSR